MDSRKIVYRETGAVLVGQLLCCAAMVGIFALLGQLELTVWLGALAGLVIATGNFFVMAITATLAADKAVDQDVAGGKSMIKNSYMLRLLVIFVLLFAFVKSGWFHPIPLVLPLLFVRPIITLGEFFRKKGDDK